MQYKKEIINEPGIPDDLHLQEVNMYIPDIETRSRSEIKVYQESRLKELLQYLDTRSPFYRDLFRKSSININSIKTLEDLASIPFTTKQDLNEKNNEFICVERSKIIDYVTTSGTLGDPVTFALTQKDFDRLAYNEYISFICADGDKDDIYQLMCTLDRRFMAGMAYFLGINKMGAGMIRVGNGLPELQWDTIKRINPTILIAVPSFIIKMIDYAEKNNIKYNESSIQKAVCIGENIRNVDFSYNNLGKLIADRWNIKLYSTYASTEKATSFTECAEGKGGHHHPELIIIEIIDENGNHVKEGESGELVFTTLGVEGMPLLRYKSGDICQYFSDPCNCGRTTTRLGPIIGRKNQMIKYKGTTLYPPSLYDILDDFIDVLNYYVEVKSNDIGTDEILLHIFSNKPSEKLEKSIKDKFRSKIRVAPSLIFEDEISVRKVTHPETSRKAVKFIDKRI